MEAREWIEGVESARRLWWPAVVERRWRGCREEAERRWRKGSGLRESNQPGDCGGKPEWRGFWSKGFWVLGLSKTQTFQKREIVDDEQRQAASRGGRERSRNS